MSMRRWAVAGMAWALVAFASPDRAEAIGFDFYWTGSAGYSVTGSFSYDDALIATGPITAAELDTFMFQALRNGILLGMFELPADLDTGMLFNFNFDTTIEQFIVGGLSFSSSGQEWNSNYERVFLNQSQYGCDVGGIGFAIGLVSEGLCVNRNWVGSIPVGQSTLAVTRQEIVSEPAGLAVLALGLVGLAWTRRRGALSH